MPSSVDLARDPRAIVEDQSVVASLPHRLREVEVVAMERIELHVLQRERIAPCRDDHLVARLRGMGENARKTVEHALAELDHVVTGSTGSKVRNDVLAEIGSKHEGIRPPCRS